MTITRETTDTLRYLVTHETRAEPLRVVMLDDGEDAPASDAPQRIASAVYERLSGLARLAPDTVERALLLPEHLAGQTELALRLLAADLEQLIREQLITGVAVAFIALAASPTSEANTCDLRYLATFRVRQPLAAPSSSGPIPATDADTDAPFARFDPTSLASVEGEPALLVAWSPAMPPAARALAIAFPRYQFAWAPRYTVILDEQGEAAAPPARAAGAWTQCRLDATIAPA
jgi:hypothetical protein